MTNNDPIGSLTGAAVNMAMLGLTANMMNESMKMINGGARARKRSKKRRRRKK